MRRIAMCCVLLALAGMTNAAEDQMMEKCHVVDKDGNNIIREGMADSGYNIENDDDAWIWVPAGECAKMNAGDYSGVSNAILSKIHPSDIENAPTLD